MPSALAVLPPPGCADFRSSEAKFRGIAPIEASTVFCFPSRRSSTEACCRPAPPRQGAAGRAEFLFPIRLRRVITVALLNAGLGRRGDRGDQGTARVVWVESKGLGNRRRDVLNG